MTERVTFADFDTTVHGPRDLLQIGADGQRPGVAEEMADTFGVNIDPGDPTKIFFKKLVSAVSRNSLLQQNIPEAERTIGEDQAYQVAVDWMDRSEVLEPKRGQLAGAEGLWEHYDRAILFGGVGRWMKRRADALENAMNTTEPFNIHGTQFSRIILAGARRPMDISEDPENVVEGMPETRFLGTVIAPRVNQGSGDLSYGAHDVDIISAPNFGGDNVARMAAESVADLVQKLDSRFLILSPAGMAPQDGVKFREAAMRINQRFDIWNDQLSVITDEIDLDRTGENSPEYGQNAITGLGIITRGLLAYRRLFDQLSRQQAN